MALADVVRKGVAIASKTFDSMKGPVVHYAWIGQDGRGGDVFAAPVSRRALIDLTKRRFATGSGQLITTFASLTFLDAIADTTATAPAVRENPIDPRDRIVLPDGTTAPIVQAGGFNDTKTSRPYLQEVVLGS